MVKYYEGMYQAIPHDFSKKKAVNNLPQKENNDYLKNHPSKWTDEMVEFRFEEAVATLKKLPDVKVQGYFNLWPQMKYSPNEVLQQEVIGRKLRATPPEISRLDQVIEWSSWLNERERKIIWKRAMNIRWKIIQYEFGCDKSTVWRYYKLALAKISSRLNGC